MGPMQRVVFVWALAGLALGAQQAPRKHNMVSTFLDKALEEVLAGLEGRNLTAGVEDVELGEDVGRFTELTVGAVGEVRKRVDGIRGWGFLLDVEVDAVAVGGRYDLVHLDVPMLFPFFGKGSFSVLLEGVAVGVNLEASYDFSKDAFDIELPRLQLTVRRAKVKFDNLMNDPSVADFLNQLISNLAPDLLQMLTDPLLNHLKPSLASYANGIILCIKHEIGDNSKVKQCIQDLFRPPPDLTRLLLRSLTSALAPPTHDPSPAGRRPRTSHTN